MATNRIVKTQATIVPAAAVKRATPVEIAIAVTRFKDRGTGYRMKLLKKHPRAFIKGDDIYVTRPGATLRFTLISATGDKASYFPLGIAFVRQGDRNTSDRQRLGLLNFPQDRIRLAGRSISITDAYVDGRQRVRYKFSVIIQRGSDGKIGLIDPGIVHEDDHIV